MKTLSQFDCQLISGGFPEVNSNDPSKVLTKEDVCFMATAGIVIGGITGLVKLSSYPLIGLSIGTVLGGVLFPITAHYLGQMMVASYEMTGVI
ncbi:MAG: hypothetical protein AB7I18_11330 [Candidatus Berkiella sp.]